MKSDSESKMQAVNQQRAIRVGGLGNEENIMPNCKNCRCDRRHKDATLWSTA
jgi:hypothetical protein